MTVDEKCRQAVRRLRAAQERTPVPAVAERVAWLAGVERALDERRDALFAALRADLNKPEIETLLSEVKLCRDEARLMRRKLPRWMRGERVTSNWLTFPAKTRLMPHPRGVVLVLGPWNYPVRLAVAPVLAALAAGNRVILKPSERAPETSRALRDLFAQTVGDDVVTVIEGGRDVAEALLDQLFDLVFFTGSTATGRAVQQRAAAQGAPLILELGGKSPAIVHPTANLQVAARRITWGKFLNAGQSCIAPDFVCVHETRHDAFVAALEVEMRAAYPDQASLQDGYSRIVAPADFDRLEALVAAGASGAPNGGRPPIRTGVPDRERLIVPPTVLPGVTRDHPAMRAEIFGPILPVLPYRDDQELMGWLRTMPAPLATYLFSDDRATGEVFERGTVSGAFVVNDVVRYLSNLRLPFGGVGASGFGRYHGWYGFEAFSHIRPVVTRRSWFSLFDLRPPYGEQGRHLLRWLR